MAKKDSLQAKQKAASDKRAAADTSDGKTPLASSLAKLLFFLVAGLACAFYLKRYGPFATKITKPAVLLTYLEYSERYPRNEEPKLLQTEVSRRLLIFNGNLMELSAKNAAYLLGLSPESRQQSPFVSDRTFSERQDVLSQLDEFNYTKILKMANVSAELPVSAAKLETAGSVNRWLSRLVSGEAHFEIPNLPLEDQKDPSRVTHIDADLRSCLGPLRDQRACGACYAFSWLSLVEWHYCRQTGELIDLSEQHVIDCGFKAQLNGCVDGHISRTREFTHVFGLQLEKDYPYVARQQRCSSPKGKLTGRSVDFKRIVNNRQEWERTLQEQPIVVEVRLPRDIMRYKRGVHPGDNCDSKFGHGMLLVGHGREEGKPYWILRNSMGRTFGENGYLRLSREAPMTSCFGAAFVTKIRFLDTSVSEEQYEAAYDSFLFEPTELVKGASKNLAT